MVQKVNLVSDSENDSVAEVENDPGTCIIYKENFSYFTFVFFVVNI